MKFMINDYILIWHLLFASSISESIYELKQKLWMNYKIEYNNVYKDKKQILKELKNFIPNDDTIYNFLLESKEYEKVKKQTEKYRIEIMNIWDKNKKQIEKSWNQIMKKDYIPCTILVVHEDLNIIELSENNEENKMIIYGKKIDRRNPLKTILHILLTLVKKELENLPSEQREITNAIIELAILNEFATQLSNKSTYQKESSTLEKTKRKIYPYWLMYLGIPKEKMQEYMERDKIFFSANEYAYEKELKKMDLEEFIQFCIRNQKYIMKKEMIEVI